MARYTTLEIDALALAEVSRFFAHLSEADPIVSLIRTGPSVEQVWIDDKHVDFVVKSEAGWDIGGWSAREFFGDNPSVIQSISGVPFGFETEAVASSFDGQLLTFLAGGYRLLPGV